jgi:outer membrane lipoprotein-sorting protein
VGSLRRRSVFSSGRRIFVGVSDASFERMDVRIDGETLRVAEVVIFDLLGNRTRLAFTESEENVGLEERVFTIRVPDDTEVIDLRK